MELAKVWPLEPGVKGVTADGSTATLKLGVPGFMELQAALDAEQQDRVQLMAGKGWADLKEPRTSAKAPVAKAEYKTAEMQAEAKPAPEVQPEGKQEPAANEYRTADMQPKRGRPAKSDKG